MAGLMTRPQLTCSVDAFVALGEVHSLGLTHRALHPSRVWLGRRLRVMFSDFHLARLAADRTIAAWAPDIELSDDFRAPECSADIRVATPESDVYSLSLVSGVLAPRRGRH